VRTVRSAARARNRPRRRHAIAVIAIILGLIALAARTAAADRFEPPVEPADRGAEDDFDDDGFDASEPPLAVPADVVALPAAPPIARVIAAAHAVAGLDRDPGRGWVRRARLAGLVPIVSAADGSDATWHEVDPNIGRTRFFEVRATWHLERLLFDPNELHVATIEASRRRERRRLANLVIRAYFTWRRAAAAAVHHPRWGSHAEQAVAELDALTDGWFSQALTDPYPSTRPTRAPRSPVPAEHHDR